MGKTVKDNNEERESRRHIKEPEPKVCPDCQGFGFINGEICSRCEGTGEVYE